MAKKIGRVKPKKKSRKTPVRRAVKKPVKKSPALRPKTQVITDYLDDIYNLKTFKATAKRTIAKLRQLRKSKKTRFEAIAFRGSSGAAMAFIAGLELGVPLIHVRKPKEDSHYSGYEGIANPATYVIIDDFISSGATVRAIRTGVTDFHKKHNAMGEWDWAKRRERPGKFASCQPKCVGIVLYSTTVGDGKDCGTKYGCPVFGTRKRY